MTGTPKLRTRARWGDTLVRQLRKGRGLTQTLRLLRIDHTTLSRATRRDPELAEAVRKAVEGGDA